MLVFFGGSFKLKAVIFAVTGVIWLVVALSVPDFGGIRPIFFAVGALWFVMAGVMLYMGLQADKSRQAGPPGAPGF